MSDFALPDVGEGLTEAEVVAWFVDVGDAVAVNDPVVEIETAKSIVELPSPFAGVVEELLVVEGATVPVGTVLLRIAEDRHARARPVPPAQRLDAASDAAAASEQEPEASRSAVVGSAPGASAPRRFHLPERNRRSVAAADDRGAPRALEGVSDRGATAGAPAARETRSPIKGMRKAIATAMTRSAFSAPHVTEWLSVDMTETMSLIAELRAEREWQAVRINPLLLTARALLLAKRAFPDINASWDEEAQEIVVKHDVNLGIAVSSPRGLIVPNIKEADALGFAELANALQSLVARARAGACTPYEQSGGTVTIANIGTFGVDGGTPILNPGEAAILALGRVRPMPWVIDGEVVPRQVGHLALSFDHRLVDGALGSAVLSTVGGILADPGRGILYP